MHTKEFSISQALDEHKMRKTPVRLAVLSHFKKMGHSLSQPDIEDEFRKEFDRVTIYRTLHAFIETGLIHKVPSEDGVTRYGLCLHSHSHKAPHKHEHIHFLCLACDKTICIETDLVPDIHLPEGYTSQEVSLFVKGICKECGRA